MNYYTSYNAFTYNEVVYASNGFAVANILTTSSHTVGGISATSSALAFSTTGWVAGTYTANTIIRDSATTYNTVVNSITFTVNNALATPTISPSSAQANTTGQRVTFAAYETGGSSPYTYNFLVYNSATNILVASMLTSSNSFAYLLPLGESGNSLYANVFVTDSATIPTSVNSILSGKITVTTGTTSTTTTIPCTGGCAQGSGGSGASSTTTVQGRQPNLQLQLPLQAPLQLQTPLPLPFRPQQPSFL